MKLAPLFASSTRALMACSLRVLPVELRWTLMVGASPGEAREPSPHEREVVDVLYPDWSWIARKSGNNASVPDASGVANRTQLRRPEIHEFTASPPTNGSPRCPSLPNTG